MPGHELIAPTRCDHRGEVARCGRDHPGPHQHARFCRFRHQPQFARSDAPATPMTCASRPGGSSGGTVTAVTANLAMLGTGTDTANSIRMPVADQRGGGRVSDARTGEHRRHRAAGLDARQYRPHRAQCDRCGDRAGGDGGRGCRRSAHRPRAGGGAARAVYAIPQAGSLKGKRFGVPAFMLQRYLDAVPWHPRRCAGPRGPEAHRRPLPAAGSRDPRRLYEKSRRVARGGRHHRDGR